MDLTKEELEVLKPGRSLLQQLAADFFELVDKDTIQQALWGMKERPPHIVRLGQFALWLAEMEDFSN